MGLDTLSTLLKLSNPFEDEYLTQELAFYNNSKPWEGKEARVKMTGEHFGRVDDFFNSNMRQAPSVPVLHVATPSRVLREPWELAMSLSYMEMQSSWMPIQMAEGICATGGLGLGYYPLRVIAKEEVEKLWIFERNADVIKAFEERFSHRDGFDKCEFVHGPAREHFQGYEVDHCFMDIYHSLLSDEMISDTKLFLDRNEIGFYHFWTMEKMALDAVNHDLMTYADMPMTMRLLLNLWTETEINEDGTMMSDLYEIGAETDYCRRAIRTLSNGGQDWTSIW